MRPATRSSIRGRIASWSGNGRPLHPEFAYLPRKFKIAITGGDRRSRGDPGPRHRVCRSLRTPRAKSASACWSAAASAARRSSATSIREFLPRAEILNYLDAILRVYNRFGRRDNKYKARIKILVKERTPEVFARDVEAEWEHLQGRSRDGARRGNRASDAHFSGRRPTKRFAGDDCRLQVATSPTTARSRTGRSATSIAHKVAGYAIVTLSLKKTGVPPGDVTSDQMDAIADLADRYSFGELRGVARAEPDLCRRAARRTCSRCGRELKALGFATPNIGLLTNIVCCPGGDFCSLANAKSIPIAEAIQRRFDDLDYLHDIGEIDLNISGCMNACGHHHVGHIGILGVDKNGAEWYQVSIGGTQGNDAALGKVIGPSFAAQEMPDVVGAADRRRISSIGTRTSASSTPCTGSASNPSRNAFMPQLIKDRAARRRSAGRCCAKRGVAGHSARIRCR